MLKKLINKIKNQFPSQKQFTSALENAMTNTMYLIEFKDNTSKIVNGRDFLKLDARKIKNFKRKSL